jgi:hypothetical protein
MTSNMHHGHCSNAEYMHVHDRQLECMKVSDCSGIHEQGAKDDISSDTRSICLCR